MKKLFAIIALFLVLAMAVVSLVYDYQNNGNCVTMLAGLWSAAATIALGGIAYWQNKKYKQLADQQSDLAFMPDLYISTSLTDALTVSGLSSFVKVRGGMQDDIGTIACQPIRLWFLKGPIVDLRAVEVRQGEKRWLYSKRDGVTFRDESKPFNLVLDIPKRTEDQDSSFVVILEYKNIYGTCYQKEICFSVENGNASPTVQILKRSRRIDNG